jgi:hypothetical protein
MKVVSWSVRGLGGLEKRKEVMLLVGEKVPFILYIQFTKLQLCDDFYVPHCGVISLVLFLISGLLKRQEVCRGCGIFLKWRFGPLSVVITF